MYKNLKPLLKERKITMDQVQEALEVKSKSTTSLKVNGKAHITFEEAVRLRDLINSKGRKKLTLEQLFEVE